MKGIPIPRRHSGRSFRLLFLMYAIAGGLGALIAIASGLISIALDGSVTPERFAVVFMCFMPMFLFAIYMIWRNYIHPRIIFDRKSDWDQFYDELEKRQHSGYHPRF